VRWIGWLGLWIVSLGVGEVFMARFQSRPGPVGEVAACWPSDTAIARRSGRPTLVVFLHPYCPCSRATLIELERVTTRCAGLADVQVVVSWDSEQAPDSPVAILEDARAIAGVQVRFDLGAKEARRFGAATSGMAFLYDASGALQFQGGITAGRGHEGDNGGEESLVASLEHGTRHSGAAPVYGCPIFGAAR
jgi:hypothetical protein